MRKLDTNTTNFSDEKQVRQNPDRYFHVMTKGWYIFTREGIKGPFYDKSRAALFLQQHIGDPVGHSGAGESWR